MAVSSKPHAMSTPVSELFHVTVRVVLVAVRSVIFGWAGAVWRTEGGRGGEGRERGRGRREREGRGRVQRVRT